MRDKPIKILQDGPEKSLLLFLALSFGFVYLMAFIWPLTPIYQGDNAPVFLMEAVRMMRGDVLYRDFFELTFPGIQTVYLGFFKVFGVRAWIPAAILVAFGIVLGWLSVVISRCVTRGASVYLAGALYLTCAFANALDATHHWFSIAAVLAALAVAIEERTIYRVAAAGAFCGLATDFTQSRGVVAVAAFLIYLLWESRRFSRGRKWFASRLTALCAGTALTSAPFIGYWIWKVGWKIFWWSTFSFVIHYYSYFNRNNLGVYMVDVPTFGLPLEIPALTVWLFIYALVPLVYLLFLARYWRLGRQSSPDPWDRLMLINTIGLALFVAIVSAPNWFKIASSTLPALILLVWFLNAPGKTGKRLLTVFWAIAAGMALAGPAITQFDWHATFRAPVGRIGLLDSTRYNEYLWLTRRTRPGDYVFEAGDTDIYFPLELRNPAPVPFITPDDYTRPEQVRAIRDSLQKDQVEYVIWSPWLDLPDSARKDGDNLRPLRDFLRERYSVVKTFAGGDQVWKLNDLPDVNSRASGP